MRLAFVLVLISGAALVACKREGATQMGLTNWENAPALVGSETIGGTVVEVAGEGGAPGAVPARAGARGGREGGARGPGGGNMTPEQLAAMRERMANMTPAEREAMQAQRGGGRQGGGREGGRRGPPPGGAAPAPAPAPTPAQ